MHKRIKFPAEINFVPRLVLLSIAGFVLASCQSSSTANNQPHSLVTSDQVAGNGTAELSQDGQTANNENIELASHTQPSPGLCSIVLASGPPPKPAKGADFGSAVAKNTGKAIQRGILQQIGGRVGGGLGAAVGGAIGRATIKNEENIKGVWKITDGAQNCACEISIDSAWQLQGKGRDNGTSKKRGCSNPTLNSISRWALGHSFTGYGAKFDFKASDNQTVLATMTRDGIHYFSGTLANGTPVTMWRAGQNYKQLSAFNKTAQ